MNQSDFDILYWASKPPQLRILPCIPPSGGPDPFSDRIAQAMALAQSGQIIDTPIMVWGWDPFLTMTLRQSFGYQSVPSAVTNKPIKVSLDPADYPPFK